MWPAPEQTSSTGPGGAVRMSSAAQRDWAAVHGRGRQYLLVVLDPEALEVDDLGSDRRQLLSGSEEMA